MPSLPSKSEIKEFLKAHYEIVDQRHQTRNWLERLFGGVPDPSQWNYDIYSILELDLGGFFEVFLLFEVQADYPFLETTSLPVSKISTGYFAYDGKKIRYLNDGDHFSNLESLLRLEDKSILEADASKLARFVCQAMLRDGHKNARLLASQKDRPWEADRHYHYEVNVSEYERIESEIQSPEISTEEEEVCLSFCALYGWMHRVEELYKYRMLVSNNSSIRLSKELLTRNFFSSVPHIRY